ncbi:MAG: DciA family protein [Candidatus Omnitrophota bacterium]|jgi:hypothetical protein
MDAIKDVVNEVIKGLQHQKGRTAKEGPEFLLKRALRKKEISHARFRYLRNGVLGITVDSSGWLYQLSLRKQGLLEKLSGKPGNIKDIRFYLGDMQ